VSGPWTFRRPVSRFIFRILAVSLRHLPPWSVGGEIVFPSGPSRRETRTNHVGIVGVDVWGRSVGRAVSGFWFLLLSSAHTRCIYIHITKPPVADDRGLMARPFVPRITHTHIYIIYSVFPFHPVRLCVRSQNCDFQPS